MIRLLLTFVGALLIGALTAFFLFVPILTIATTTAILMGLVLMFCLGVQVGNRELVPVQREGKRLYDAN